MRPSPTRRCVARKRSPAIELDRLWSDATPRYSGLPHWPRFTPVVPPALARLKSPRQMSSFLISASKFNRLGFRGRSREGQLEQDIWIADCGGAQLRAVRLFLTPNEDALRDRNW